MKQKNKRKRSTKMLWGGAIFLSLYILATVIFGSVIVKDHAATIAVPGGFGYSMVLD